MVAALLYSCFPRLFTVIWDTIRAIVLAGRAYASHTIGARPTNTARAVLT
jgi:hypothetical protein